MKNTAVTSPAHTAGPWLVREKFGLKKMPTDHMQEVIAILGGTESTKDIVAEIGLSADGCNAQFDDVRKANARLIAAAPELLDACKMVLENAEKDGYVNAGILTDVQTAIAKAA